MRLKEDGKVKGEVLLTITSSFQAQQATDESATAGQQPSEGSASPGTHPGHQPSQAPPPPPSSTPSGGAEGADAEGGSDDEPSATGDLQTKGHQKLGQLQPLPEESPSDEEEPEKSESPELPASLEGAVGGLEEGTQSQASPRDPHRSPENQYAFEGVSDPNVSRGNLTSCTFAVHVANDASRSTPASRRASRHFPIGPEPRPLPTPVPQLLSCC